MESKIGLIVVVGIALILAVCMTLMTGCVNCIAENVTKGDLHIDHLEWQSFCKDFTVKDGPMEMTSTSNKATVVVPPYVYVKTTGENNEE